MILLLKKRGTLIKQEKWDKVKEITAEMNEFLSQNKEKFITPCSVFMSFLDEEGYNRCCGFEETCNDEHDENLRKLSSFLGEPGEPNEIDIMEASEPSDIIWEHRHFTKA